MKLTDEVKLYETAKMGGLMKEIKQWNLQNTWMLKNNVLNIISYGDNCAADVLSPCFGPFTNAIIFDIAVLAKKYSNKKHKRATVER